MASENQPTGPLTRLQEDLLRTLARAAGWTSAEDLDGRTLRALSRRSLIEQTAEGVQITAQGRNLYEHSIRRRRRRPGQRRPQSPSLRAEQIHAAIRNLELALPSKAMLRVGSEPVSAAELLASLKRFT